MNNGQSARPDGTAPSDGSDRRRQVFGEASANCVEVQFLLPAPIMADTYTIWKTGRRFNYLVTRGPSDTWWRNSIVGVRSTKASARRAARKDAEKRERGEREHVAIERFTA